MRLLKNSLVLLLFPFLGAAQEQSVIPARISDSPSDNLFVMTLGAVHTPLADGMFNIQTDVLTLRDGQTISHYYRDSLHIAFYAPIDKSVFPLPPSGWCSWYYYYQEISEDEVERNARWIADNLLEYGARYVQIDDGWQGMGHGMGGNRDWTTIDERFPSGMDHLAAVIRTLNLKAGLWLAPHGQSNESVVRRNPGVFLLKDNDSTASNTWEGTFLVDPSTRHGHVFLKNLFSTLSAWGYEYFKIDGQPIVVNEYRTKKSFMQQPAENTDSLYRSTLQTIRSAIGPNRYLLGCWGIPLEGTGIMNGSRTGGDVVLGWSGFKVALQATMQYYFLHNVTWYSDPDVMLLRSPLTIPQAEAWATLQGLTGQALMASDRMMDLSAERVEILRRVYPAVDIRPLDLFPSKSEKEIWDLKISHLGAQYDVVGVFNFHETESRMHFLSWKELALNTDGPVHVFDFWNKEYLGAWEKGIAVALEPASCRVLSLVPMTGHPQLVSTSRHITQGWVDLLEATFDKQRQSYSGKSRVIRNDPYEIRFAFPRGVGLKIVNATAGNLPVDISNHQGWATVRFTSPRTTEIRWRVTFGPAEYYHYPVRTPSGLRIARAGINGVNVVWNDSYYLTAGYEVYLNNRMLGYASSASFPIRNLSLDSIYTVSVRSVWQDGRPSEREAVITFSPDSLLPKELWLDEIPPDQAIAGYGSVEMNRAVSQRPLKLGGKLYTRGIGTHAVSEITYDLQGRFNMFSALVGVDENNGRPLGSVEFIVIGDGRELWRSGVMRRDEAPRNCIVRISGVNTLTLKVLDAGDGIDYDHADWVNAKISISIP